MPYYENGCVKSLIDNRFLTTREIVRYSLQFLSGLNSIHVKGLLHFDVKPENILINKANQALISDFGLAQYANRYGFAVSFGTTPVLAPPEFFQQQIHNLKFDIYQAGLTLYRLCVGDQIFINQITSARNLRGVSNDDNLYQKIIRGQFPNRQFYFSHIPRSLRRVITKAMNVNPDNRYSSIVEMMDDIAKVSPINDWQFSTDYQNIEEWTENNKVVVANFDNTVWKVESKKNNRRKNQYCSTNLSLSQKNALVYTALNTNW